MTPASMQLVVAPLLWAEREHGADNAFCGAVYGDQQFLIVADTSGTASLIRERSSDADAWRDLACHDEFAEAVEALAGLLDSLMTASPPGEGTVVLALPAADGLVGVVRTASGYSRAFEPWDEIGAVTLEGGTRPTITEVLREDIDDMYING